MLRGSDVLLAILEPEASSFAVPSKVLTYICAGRPVLGSMPIGNLAARIINHAGAGFVVSPGELQVLVKSARALRENPDLRKGLGEAGRAYAEQQFRIDDIARQFLEIFTAGQFATGGATV